MAAAAMAAVGCLPVQVQVQLQVQGHCQQVSRPAAPSASTQAATQLALASFRLPWLLSPPQAAVQAPCPSSIPQPAAYATYPWLRLLLPLTMAGPCSSVKAAEAAAVVAVAVLVLA